MTDKNYFSANSKIIFNDGTRLEMVDRIPGFIKAIFFIAGIVFCWLFYKMLMRPDTFTEIKPGWSYILVALVAAGFLSVPFLARRIVKITFIKADRSVRVLTRTISGKTTEELYTFSQIKEVNVHRFEQSSNNVTSRNIGHAAEVIFSNGRSARFAMSESKGVVLKEATELCSFLDCILVDRTEESRQSPEEMNDTVKEKALSFIKDKPPLTQPGYIREGFFNQQLVISYSRSRSWTLEELFVSVFLSVFVFMLAVVAGLIAFSATDSLTIAIAAGLISLVPLFYLDFIWLFTRVEFVITSETITKTLNYGIFKRVHEVTTGEILQFTKHELVLQSGDWKLASKEKTNEYLIVRVATFLAKGK